MILRTSRLVRHVPAHLARQAALKAALCASLGTTPANSSGHSEKLSIIRRKRLVSSAVGGSAKGLFMGDPAGCYRTTNPRENRHTPRFDD